MRQPLLLTLLSTLALSGLSLSVHAESEAQTGHARIYVKNESGQYVPNARVYLYDGEKLSYVESSFLGAVSLDLKPGRYTVTSAIILPVVDAMDRYVSPEAHIEILPEDTTSVVLTLHPVLAEELTSAALEKMGVADEVAKYQPLN